MTRVNVGHATDMWGISKQKVGLTMTATNAPKRTLATLKATTKAANAAKPERKNPPHPTDIWIGKRIRARRLECGMSQTDLGGELVVAFQQVQKYEKGTNRVSGSRLLAIADVLKCEVSYFFPPRDGNGPPDVLAFADSHEAMRLLRGFAHIADAKMRVTLVELVESVAATAPSEVRSANGASAPTPLSATEENPSRSGGGR